MTILFAATVFLSINTISALTNLAGNIGGMVLTADGNPYVVTKDITIPANENTVIREGCRLFFRQLTGLTVNGDLTIAGTEERPVFVTSLNDSLSPEKNGQLPNPFDWNGIIISKTAGDIKLSDFTFSYSTFGIKSQKNIFIKNGTFRQNGQFHFTVQEAIKPVVDGIPFTYATYTVACNANNAESGEVPIDAQRYLSGDIVTVPGNAGNLVKTDNSFVGWSKSSDGSGNDYTPGSSFMMGDSDVVLYAKWLSDRPIVPATAGPTDGKRGSDVFV